MAAASRSAPIHSFAFTPRAARAPVRLAVQHRGRGAGARLLDETEDISASGVFVHCDEPYMVGTAVSLELLLDDGHVHLEGRVVRVGAGRSGRGGMGILYTRLDDVARARIERLVNVALDDRR
ncbi:MAG TPA: PilZ domain-containing protein [Anaeromyxobacteraceae bacterium]